MNDALAPLLGIGGIVFIALVAATWAVALVKWYER